MIGKREVVAKREVPGSGRRGELIGDGGVQEAWQSVDEISVHRERPSVDLGRLQVDLGRDDRLG